MQHLVDFFSRKITPQAANTSQNILKEDYREIDIFQRIPFELRNQSM